MVIKEGSVITIRTKLGGAYQTSKMKVARVTLRRADNQPQQWQTWVSGEVVGSNTYRSFRFWDGGLVEIMAVDNE